MHSDLENICQCFEIRYKIKIPNEVTTLSLNTTNPLLNFCGTLIYSMKSNGVVWGMHKKI